MQVAIDRQASGLKPHLSLVSLFEALLDPIAFSGSLLAVAALHGVAGDPAYVVLAVTVLMVMLLLHKVLVVVLAKALDFQLFIQTKLQKLSMHDCM